MSDNEDVGGGRAVVDFEELAQVAAPAKAPLNPAEVKLEGDSIPEALRGKSLADVLALQAAQTQALEASKATIDALRTSSDAVRIAQERQAPPPPPAPVAEPELTQAQLKELYEKDPFEYNQYVLGQMEKRMAKTIDARVAPMSVTTAASAESQARQKFAEEFQVLGPEIAAITRQIPPDQLATPGAYEKILYYVRGEHMDKLLAARDSKQREKALEEARQRELTNGGVTSTGTRGVSGRRQVGELTAEQKEVCKVQGITEDDFRKYYI